MAGTARIKKIHQKISPPGTGHGMSVRLRAFYTSVQSFPESQMKNRRYCIVAPPLPIAALMRASRDSQSTRSE